MQLENLIKSLPENVEFTLKTEYDEVLCYITVSRDDKPTSRALLKCEVVSVDFVAKVIVIDTPYETTARAYLAAYYNADYFRVDFEEFLDNPDNVHPVAVANMEVYADIDECCLIYKIDGREVYRKQAESGAMFLQWLSELEYSKELECCARHAN